MGRFSILLSGVAFLAFAPMPAMSAPATSVTANGTPDSGHAASTAGQSKTQQENGHGGSSGGKNNFDLSGTWSVSDGIEQKAHDRGSQAKGSAIRGIGQDDVANAKVPDSGHPQKRDETVVVTAERKAELHRHGSESSKAHSSIAPTADIPTSDTVRAAQTSHGGSDPQALDDTATETVVVTGSRIPQGVAAKEDRDGTLHVGKLNWGTYVVHVSDGRIPRALKSGSKPALLVNGKTIPLECSRRTGDCVSGPLALGEYDSLGRIIFVGGTVKL